MGNHDARNCDEKNVSVDVFTVRAAARKKCIYKYACKYIREFPVHAAARKNVFTHVLKKTGKREKNAFIHCF